MSKKTMIILGVIALLGIIAVIVYFMQKESTALKRSQATTSEMQALIDNYESITDFNTQAAVWFHVFKTCPYWSAYVKEQFQMHGAGELGNIEIRYAIEAENCINKGYKPADYLKKCNDKFISQMDAFNECQKKKKTANTWSWILGIATGGVSYLKGNALTTVKC